MRTKTEEEKLQEIEKRIHELEEECREMGLDIKEAVVGPLF